MPHPGMNGDGQLLRTAINTMTIIGAIVASAFWLKDELNGLDARLTKIEAQVGERWTSKDQALWAAQLKINNVELDVPSVKEIVDWDNPRKKGTN